ncbi:hypothetical protein M0657_006399 [Pyricularia oryzae]|uniref:Uncharacterized protein n=1 Tax=Pyricularia oryzae TaxID=318829 RepID=A0A4V1C7F6_PYROR|nr:hypothetical protein M0657_006399 [Pyricularia oryzae]KAI7927098.1 hypothetical protein M9X92_002430 [Pyricularia oryzae]QBZ63218.1 hypothetical protein PoMZ_12115 [Pyricularia oryzae]
MNGGRRHFGAPTSGPMESAIAFRTIKARRVDPFPAAICHSTDFCCVSDFLVTN